MEDLKEGAENIFSDENLKRNRENLCEICGNDVENDQNGICCDNCDRWFHYSCCKIKNTPKTDWFCSLCVGKKPTFKQNIFDKDPVVLAERKEEEFKTFVSSIPTSAFFCEPCKKEFITDEELSIHNEFVHETGAADGGSGGRKKKKSKKNKKKSDGNNRRSKKNKKILKKSRRSGKKKK